MCIRDRLSGINEKLQINQHLTIQETFFQVGILGADKKYHYHYSESKTVKAGESFAVRVNFMAEEPFKLTFKLKAPGSVKTFNSRSGKVTFDNSSQTVAVDYEIDPMRITLEHFWGTDSRDPIGDYEMSVFANDKFIHKYNFKLVN